MKFRRGFRFIDYQRLLEGSGLHLERTCYAVPDVGYRNRVIFLINDGIDRGLWDLQNKAERQNDILVAICRFHRNPDR